MSADATDTPADIIEATGQALCKWGYADLTVQRIAEEAAMTTAAIHYHFDTKEELLNAFLDDLMAAFERQLACDASDPRERLAALLDAVFTPSETGSDDLPVAMMELKAQAPYSDRFREQFRTLDATVQSAVASAVRDGVEAGHFDDADPEAVARLVTTAINGGHARKVALGEDPAATRAAVEGYLQSQLGWRPEGSP